MSFAIHLIQQNISHLHGRLPGTLAQDAVLERPFSTVGKVLRRLPARTSA